VGSTLRCVEREADNFSPGIHLTGYTWQLTVAFNQGRSVSAIRLLSVVPFKGKIPLYILIYEELVLFRH